MAWHLNEVRLAKGVALYRTFGDNIGGSVCTTHHEVTDRRPEWVRHPTARSKMRAPRFVSDQRPLAEEISLVQGNQVFLHPVVVGLCHLHATGVQDEKRVSRVTLPHDVLPVGERRRLQ